MPQVDNQRIHDLEQKLRRAVELSVATHAFDAHSAGLPRHLIIYQIEAATQAVFKRMREWG